MHPHHQAAIERLTAHFRDDPAFPALIVAGSLVKGWERPDSDVDILLVATDDEYTERVVDNRLHYYSTEFCDYPGGYVDGKIIDMTFLRDVADHGSDPARAAFAGAYTAYCRWPEIDALLKRIPIYPMARQQDRLASFVAQIEAWRWYIGEAERHQDAYLMTHSVGELVLFGARLILAHNRILYPYHKWLMTALGEAPQQPAGLREHIDRLLAEPSKAHADALVECLYGFAEWPQPAEGWPARFAADREWNWRTNPPPIADW